MTQTTITTNPKQRHFPGTILPKADNSVPNPCGYTSGIDLLYYLYVSGISGYPVAEHVGRLSLTRILSRMPSLPSALIPKFFSEGGENHPVDSFPNTEDVLDICE